MPSQLPEPLPARSRDRVSCARVRCILCGRVPSLRPGKPERLPAPVTTPRRPQPRCRSVLPELRTEDSVRRIRECCSRKETPRSWRAAARQLKPGRAPTAMPGDFLPHQSRRPLRERLTKSRLAWPPRPGRCQSPAVCGQPKQKLCCK